MQRFIKHKCLNKGGYGGELTNSKRKIERQMINIIIDSDEVSTHQFKCNI